MFEKIYSSGVSYLYTAYQDSTSNGGSLIAGGWSSGANSSSGFVLRIDSSGNIQWQRGYCDSVFSGSTQFFISKIKALDNGGFVAAGDYSLNNHKEVFLFKADSLGNVIWAKKFLQHNLKLQT